MMNNTTNVDKEKARHHMAEVISAMGLEGIPDVDETPKRFVEYLAEFRQPLHLEKIFGKSFQNLSGEGDIVLQMDIPFRMLCSHHLLPALGRAAVGYLPREKVIGLSKLTRLVQGVGTEAPTLQEEATTRIADLLYDNLGAGGSMVVIKAEHTCMACRGINRDRVYTITCQTRGKFATDATTRREFFELCNFHPNTR